MSVVTPWGQADDRRSIYSGQFDSGVGRGVNLHLVPLSTYLGEPLPLADLDDWLVQENLDELLAQGIATVRVSMMDSPVLAAKVTPTDLAFDAVVVSSDTSSECDGPSKWVQRYRAETGLDDVPILYVSGEACANFAAAVGVAEGLCAAGKAETVLWVTADRVVKDTRFPPMSMTVFSDGAASCLFTTVPAGPTFEVLGTATHRWKALEGGRNQFAYARGPLTAAREVGRALVRRNDINHLLAPNFGSATREMLAMAAAVPAERMHAGVAAETGHCFAADTLLNLDDLRRRHPLRDGDTVLALVSSNASVSGILLGYSDGGSGSPASVHTRLDDHDDI